MSRDPWDQSRSDPSRPLSPQRADAGRVTGAYGPTERPGLPRGGAQPAPGDGGAYSSSAASPVRLRDAGSGADGADRGTDREAAARPDEAAPRRKRTWPQRMILAFGLVLVMVCMLGASVAGYTLVKFNSIDRVEDLELHQAAEGEPENYLIVAPDIREGHTGVNTDTIMVLRVDPGSDDLVLTSFPRDLMVTAADTGEIGMINAVYNRPDGAGPQNLIDTLQQNYSITINHFIEVRFESFRQLVDSVGGVTMYFENWVHDNKSGFHSEELGCVTLDGERGLQFVRSRYLNILTEDGWKRDPKSDEHRVRRQQVFIQRAMAKVLADVKSNPLRMGDLIDIGVRNVTLDPNLGLGDIRNLAEQFKDFDPSELKTLPLPTVQYPEELWRTERDKNRLALDEANAEPILNVFRGLPRDEIGPGLIDVQVLNGTAADATQNRETLAVDVSGALQRVGFDVREPGNAETFFAQTTIQHAPGQQNHAVRVARHITSTAAIHTEEVADLEPGQVRVIAGADFTTVHEQATPIEEMPAPAAATAPEPGAAAPDQDAPAPDPGAAADEDAEPGAAAPDQDAPAPDPGAVAPDVGAQTPSAETSPAAPEAGPPAGTEEGNPFIIGAPPENVRC